MRVQAKHYATGKLIDIDCAKGRIQAISPAASEAPGQKVAWAAPAWFDLQINGCDGHSFNSAQLTIDMVRHIVSVCRMHGVGALLPTLVTNSFEAMVHGLATLHRACATDAALAYAIAGIHVEGPYISPEDGPRGAHPRQHVRPPSWDEFCHFQEAAGGRIKLMTLAPEHDGALRFIEQLVGAGIVVSIGHTAASGARIRDAVRAGARLSTHLGNGSHAMLPRHDNYIWEQLAADDLWASIICDGHHLPPAVIRCLLRVKTPARTILTCDASSLAGLPEGRYQEWGQEFEILPERKIVLRGTSYLGGSWAFTDLCVGEAMQSGGVSLAEAVDMASARPRELLGLPIQRLEVGQPADIVLFEWDQGGPVRVTQTAIAGEPALVGQLVRDEG